MILHLNLTDPDIQFPINCKTTFKLHVTLNGSVIHIYPSKILPDDFPRSTSTLTIDRTWLESVYVDKEDVGSTRGLLWDMIVYTSPYTPIGCRLEVVNAANSKRYFFNGCIFKIDDPNTAYPKLDATYPGLY